MPFVDSARSGKVFKGSPLGISSDYLPQNLRNNFLDPFNFTDIEDVNMRHLLNSSMPHLPVYNDSSVSGLSTSSIGGTASMKGSPMQSPISTSVNLNFVGGQQMQGMDMSKLTNSASFLGIGAAAYGNGLYQNSSLNSNSNLIMTGSGPNSPGLTKRKSTLDVGSRLFVNSLKKNLDGNNFIRSQSTMNLRALDDEDNLFKPHNISNINDTQLLLSDLQDDIFTKNKDSGLSNFVQAYPHLSPDININQNSSLSINNLSSSSTSSFKKNEEHSKKNSDKVKVKSSCINEDKKRPPVSYATLISRAILSKENQKCTLSQIYSHISLNYEYYSDPKAGSWQNSIRHNLSLNPCFKKEHIACDRGKRVIYWSIKPDRRDHFSADGEYFNKRRLRKSKGSKIMKSNSTLFNQNNIGMNFSVSSPSGSPQLNRISRDNSQLLSDSSNIDLTNLLMNDGLMVGSMNLNDSSHSLGPDSKFPTMGSMNLSDSNHSLVADTKFASTSSMNLIDSNHSLSPDSKFAANNPLLGNKYNPKVICSPSLMNNDINPTSLDMSNFNKNPDNKSSIYSHINDDTLQSSSALSIEERVLKDLGFNI